MWLFINKRARELWAQIVKCGIEGVHYLPNIFLAPKIGGAEEVGEVIVWMAGVECCDKIGKSSATGDLTEGPERTCSGQIEGFTSRCCLVR